MPVNGVSGRAHHTAAGLDSLNAIHVKTNRSTHGVFQHGGKGIFDFVHGELQLIRIGSVHIGAAIAGEARQIGVVVVETNSIDNAAVVLERAQILGIISIIAVAVSHDNQYLGKALRLGGASREGSNTFCHTRRQIGSAVGCDVI